MADRIDLTPDELRRHPLPELGEQSSKDERGTVLVIGGSLETAGALVLAGVAALRAGAGKLQLATVSSCVPALTAAMPEARVIPLDATEGGAIEPTSVAGLRDDVASADAVLVGTGTLDPDGAAELVRALLPTVADATVVIDANGLAAVSQDPGCLEPVRGRAILTPNPVEAEHLPGDGASEIADRTGAVVAVRGGTTEVAAPGGPVYVDDSGNAGLGTSGSGDVVAGLVAGFSARGADPVTALLWASAAHGRAGERCAARIAPVGYLARELLDELAPAIAELSRARR